MNNLSLQQDMAKFGHDILLVGDGLEQMSLSMAKYLNQIFNPVSLPTENEDWPDWANTCILNMAPNNLYWPNGKISLVLKKINRGKWNSHEWHMKSFAKDAKFCFLTDVGCQYNVDLLSKFIKFIKSHPNCVAVTGRRIVQTPHQQADPSSSFQEDSFMEGMLRAIQSQMCEFENNSIVENFIGGV